MSKKSIVVIGAGLSGLAAGITAQLNGYEAHILEQANQPGGVSATWKRKGFTIDGGVHFYMGMLGQGPTRELYRELGVWQPEKYRTLETYARFLDPTRGLSLDLTRDLESFVARGKEISPADGPFLDRFLAGARAFGRLDLASTMEKPPDLSNFLDSLKTMWRIKSCLKYFSGVYAQPMTQAAERIQDPWLRDVLLHFFLPGVPYFFVLMLAGTLMAGNMAVRVDGSAGFNQALEDRLTSLGGKVTYRTKVEKILVRQGRSVGVRLAGGEEIMADWVIAAGDGHSTLYDLLGPEHVPGPLARIHRELPLFDPIILVNVGLGLELSGYPETVVLRPPQKPRAGHLLHEWWFTRIFDPERGAAPPGKTLVQAMIDSAWEPWRKLREDEPAYRAEKERLAQEVIQGLDCLRPGLADKVEMVDVATPHTWWRYTLNREGAFEGFMVSAESFRTQVRRTLPGVDGLVMAGQWTMPGGGVVPCLVSGRQAVDIIRAREG